MTEPYISLWYLIHCLVEQSLTHDQLDILLWDQRN